MLVETHHEIFFWWHVVAWLPVHFIFWEKIIDSATEHREAIYIFSCSYFVVEIIIEDSIDVQAISTF